MNVLTLQSAIQRGSMQLAAHTSSPRLEAEVLLCDVLNCSRSFLYAWPEKVLTPIDYVRFLTLIDRRAAGEPIAYLTGKREFWSLPLSVTPATLIPRPETEILVEQALLRLPPNKPSVVIDLGTGSGAIALAIASAATVCQVIATDYSFAALAVAQQNARRLQLENIRFVATSWFAALGNARAQVIVSNPPYITENDLHLTQGDLRYEPHSALIAAENGLADLKHLIQRAPFYLADGGWLLVEHAPWQTGEVRDLFKKTNYTIIKFYNDLQGLARVTGGRKK